MITLKHIFRAVETIAVPVLLGLVARHFWGDQQEQTPPSLYLPLLADIDFAPRKLPVTYRTGIPEFDTYERVSALPNVTNEGTPDVTAVILNWSRFPNVMLITSLLCAPWLNGTIAEVFIWNNNPRRLTYEDMKNTGCPKSKLRIHNAPANLLFQARFMACAQADTPYCFIQDDDYLVRSEIIDTLRARITAPGASRTIHLLPPHEHLSTTLREIHVPRPDESHISDIHTSFAWLGYGTMLHRSEAHDFLNLMRYLKATPDEMKMADNFYAILKNKVPEVWFDQGFELGGGQAFTAGSEGDERNKNYTLRATRYLESLAHCGRVSCDDPAVNGHPKRKLPYVKLDGPQTPNPIPWTRTTCRGAACLLESNIRTVSDAVSHAASKVADILALEVNNAEVLGDAGKANYLEHALSNAVDSQPGSVFRSLTHAAQGDIIALDSLTDISDAREWTAVELVWLVDSPTEDILKSCTFEWSSDNTTWNGVSHPLSCYNTDQEAVVDGTQVPLRECSVQMLLSSGALHLRATGQYFRARLGEDRVARWTVSEVWLRGI
ncbi:hypothetical protein L226DRAFT_497325 [Lentinus tigrinus ALCF2SS1-7]|uniref:uncharacterized protein n=1 Tax=Lentinus tigrinus ALCF2SS1-7 TaxID=1328758 RepID=UPI0011663552|nr:hypothetical protein L226DRAFT_497325 [Lentinus tigrinus ALCF2SS1-7]